jgi:hypothetical protein
MLDELERLERAATAGRWEAEEVPRQTARGTYTRIVVVQGKRKRVLLYAPDRPDDLRLIAAARNALLRLFAGIEALRPLAKMAEAIPAYTSDNDVIISWEAGRIIVTVGDVRRAATALAALEGAPDA